MYIPILKTRRTEIATARDLSYCFSDEIIPMFEVINQTYGLDTIQEVMKGKKAFIDLFRFSVNKYKNNINIKKVEYAWNLSDNVFYMKELEKIDNTHNFIPVISLKTYFEISKYELNKLINELQKKHQSIAIRITDEYIDIDQYNDVYTRLRSNDYLILDIQEQNVDSKFIELQDFSELQILAKKVILNSPRTRERKNGEFSKGIINNIDMSLVDKYKEYNAEGYGDYAGLKDDLPHSGGSMGRGNALALLYDYKINKFICFINEDITKGVKGYIEVKKEILKKENIMNPGNDCPAFEKIKSITCGTWSTWLEITAKRYIHQVYKKNQH